jgi:hypothetical protein
MDINATDYFDVMGTTGLMGDTGIGTTGPVGPYGETGLQGMAGQVGSTGIQGNIGATGVQGLGVTEVGSFSCSLSGPCPTTTVTLLMTRIVMATGKSVVTLRVSAFTGVGNNASEEFLIDATNIPTRFRPTEERVQTGLITVEGLGRSAGYLVYSSGIYWRIWKAVWSQKFLSNGGNVGWLAFDMQWEGQ